MIYYTMILTTVVLVLIFKDTKGNKTVINNHRILSFVINSCVLLFQYDFDFLFTLLVDI